MFGQCWTGHCIEELNLHFLMAPNTKYRGVADGTNLTVVSVFAPLGHFNKVQARYSLKNVWHREEINCIKAFKGVAKILLLFLRQSNSNSSLTVSC